jgi:hypothetical protein
MKPLSAFGLVVALLVQVSTAAACSICRCGDPNFFINNARVLGSGKFIVSIEHFNTRKSSALSDHHEGDPGRAALVPILSPFSVHHGAEGNESQLQNNVLASLIYGLSDRVMLLASVPYTFNRISSADGSETANGLGDPEVTAFAQLGALANGAIALRAVAGMRVPLGASDREDENGQRLEQHLQTGTGAWAGLLGFQASALRGRVPLFFSVNYQINGANDHEFRYGNVLRYNFAVQKALVGAIDLIGEINGRSAAYDKEGSEQDPNSGGMVVYFSPGLRWRLFSVLHLRTQVQIPVVEDLNGEQDEAMNFRSGLVWAF